MKKHLIQNRWFRNIYNNTTFYLSNGKWKELSDFLKGEKIQDIDNGVGTCAWCSCGNELVHSQSFIREREVKETRMSVFDYKCSFCGMVQYRNPCLMPGIHSCDKDGILF